MDTQYLIVSIVNSGLKGFNVAIDYGQKARTSEDMILEINGQRGVFQSRIEFLLYLSRQGYKPMFIEGLGGETRFLFEKQDE